MSSNNYPRSDKAKRLRTFEELYEKIAGNGLVPPQALEIEQSVLGAALINKTACRTIYDTIADREPPFYTERHTSIWFAISKLIASGFPVDLNSVTDRLRREGELEDSGGPAYLVELTSKIVSTVNVERDTRLLIEYQLRRELIEKCEELKIRSFVGEDDTFDLLLDAEKAISDLSKVRNLGGSAWKSTADLSASVLEEIKAIADRGLDVTGIPSALSSLDRITNGWRKSDLIIIGARTSQGKTSLALVLARNAASTRDIGVAFFSLEMDATDLHQKLVCGESGLNSYDIQRGRLTPQEWKRFHEADERIKALPIFIDDTSSITPQMLRQKLRQLMQKQKNVGLIIVDYLQLMELPAKTFSNSDSREREISKISRALKALAKELQVPVIALSQLSRKTEERKEKRPMLSDLRESGAIEQDADVVLFIYRPEVYGIKNWEYPFNDNKPTDGMAELIIAKQRKGPTDSARVKFDPSCGDFSDEEIFIPEFRQEGLEF